MNDTLSTLVMPSPLGPLRLVADAHALVQLTFAEHRGSRPLDARPAGDHTVLTLARAQLEAWFARRRTDFELPLAARGTPFQQAVWAALAAIPYGARRAYADIAAALGRPSAVRAVAAANAMNPLSIVVPCHRVIGRDGSLTGYAGGLDAKAWLLAHEALEG